VGGIGLGSHYQGEIAIGDAQIAARLADPPSDVGSALGFQGLRDFRVTIQLDPATNTVVGGSLSYMAFDEDPSLSRDVFSGAAMTEGVDPFILLPGGILGEVVFLGELTLYDYAGDFLSFSKENEKNFLYASDLTGQVVLCANATSFWELEESPELGELKRQECVANALIVLQPVQGAPPVA
jgi:hypothetical protein